MTFSDRIGVTMPRQTYQLDDISDGLRNRLWSRLTRSVFPRETGHLDRSLAREFVKYYERTFDGFVKRPIDKIGDTIYEKYSLLRQLYFEFKWYEVYNLVEFVVRNFDDNSRVLAKNLAKRFNELLEEEKSGYRFVDQYLVPITDEIEMAEVADAATMKGDKYIGARTHIQKALELFSKKPKADYLNAIKEAISAVESVAREISGKKNATLGDALASLDQQKPMHGAFKQGFNNLYGYTSDEQGIRHALTDGKDNVDEADAHFMIVACSAFVNFAVSRYQ